MAKYTIQRILAMLLTMFIILTVGFMVIRLMPGGIFDDAVDMTHEQRAALEAKYNLDKPIIVQYGLFLKGLILEGDWGTSLKMNINVPVWDIIKTKIPVTLYINFFSLLISLPLGIGLGIVAAIRKNSITDYLISFLVVIFISVPSFIFATLLQYFAAFKGGLFPIIFDATSIGWARFHGLALPILALSLGPIARVTRYLRAELAETINSDFMLLAKTKGLTERAGYLKPWDPQLPASVNEHHRSHVYEHHGRKPGDRDDLLDPRHGRHYGKICQRAGLYGYACSTDFLLAGFSDHGSDRGSVLRHC